ncbi:MAG: hypothetical protein K2Q22_00325 [Cytophagales bacterium]|nr:hypothetical protein [Cytophagales bacterium]
MKPQGHYASIDEIETLVDQFKSQSLPKAKWTHEAHLTVALWYLSYYSFEEALCYLRSGIIAYNTSVGTENSPYSGYHETFTVFWTKVIDDYLKTNKSNLLTDFNNFLQSPWASRQLPLQYYSKELLFSTKARALYCEPDLA